MVAVIVAGGLALTAVVLLTNRGTGDGGAEGEPIKEAGALDYPRGPHGARLLSDGPLQLEVTIYETGVPPHFRIFAYDAGMKPVAPEQVNLHVELHRLGGRVDRIAFKPQADYLLGEGIVEEPHSFDVKVIAQVAGRRHEWTFSQIEGKVKLPPAQVASAGIVLNTTGPRRMTTIVDMPAQVRADETRLAHVVPRLQGVVISVLKQEGDRVRKGEVMAVLNSRELASADRPSRPGGCSWAK